MKQVRIIESVSTVALAYNTTVATVDLNLVEIDIGKSKCYMMPAESIAIPGGTCNKHVINM